MKHNNSCKCLWCIQKTKTTQFVKKDCSIPYPYLKRFFPQLHQTIDINQSQITQALNNGS